MKNKTRKRVAKIGWMPFWWGNKFNKRLSSKRARQHEKSQIAQKNISDTQESL